MNNGKILIVDDEDHIRDILERGLTKVGYQCVTASAAHRALALLKQYQFDFALLDVMMPGMSGLELLAEMRELHPDVGVIILTGAMELNGAITAMRDGAYDYVSKPIGTAELAVRVNGARERRRLVLENRRYQEEQKRLVAELDARQEQRTKELNALNRLFQTHVSSDLDAREAYEALRQAVSNFGAELERLATSAPGSGPAPIPGPPRRSARRCPGTSLPRPASGASLPPGQRPSAGPRWSWRPGFRRG